MYHSEHLAIACAREAAAAGQDAEAVTKERLGFSAAQADDILEKAGHEPGLRFSVDREAAGPLGDRLAVYLQGGTAGEVLKETLEALPETVEERLDLAIAAVQIAQLRTAVEGARSDGDEELLAFIEGEAEKLAEAAAGLSMLEAELMRPLDEDEQLLIEVAAIAKPIITVSMEMVPTGLTDLLDGEREIPRSMEIYLALAGQTYQQRIGPIISWSATFERLLPDGFDRQDPVEIRVALLDENDTEFLLRTTYDGEAADSHLYYPPASAIATISLAVLALTKCVRLDFYILTNTRSIRHVKQAGIVFDDRLQTEIVERAVVRCRELMADGKEGAMATIEREHSGEDAPLIAFVMNERGKSEQLLDASSAGAALGPGRQATPDQEMELAQARRGLLIAEAERIEDPSQTTREAAVSASSAYIALVQRFRGADPRDRAGHLSQEVEEMIAGVATARRAVVHLTIDSRGLELAWADCAEGPAEVDLLTCEDVDLDQLEEALSDPESGSVAVLDNPDGPGVALGMRLRKQMADRNVDELLVCSTRHLHQLPVHALRIAPDGDRRLMDEVDIVYAPSATIASRLATTPPRNGPKLAVAATGDLVHAADEASVIGHLSNAEEILVGAASTPMRVLSALRRASWVHITSHGSYQPRDYLASNLLLPIDSDPDARLTVARILAEAEVSGIDLAVLGACQSGAGQTETASLDIAGGIDTAFLAAGVRNVVSALWEIDDLGALLFHGELYRHLSEGRALVESYRAAVNLLRLGAWRQVGELPLGALLTDLGIDITAALAELKPGDDGERPVNLSDLQEWAPYRICGLGTLDP
jgi:CHAT domain-containing protein